MLGRRLLRKHKPPDDLRGTPEFKEFRKSLSEDSDLYKRIENALDKLRIDICAGAKVEKNKWPKKYKDYGISNLFKLDAGGEPRLTYTIIAEGDKKIVCIIEFFSNHKKYNRRFGYTK